MILPGALLAVLWGMAIARVPAFWRNPTQRALSAAVLALAVSRTVAFPPIAAELRTPAPQHLAAMIAAYFLLRFILLVIGRAGRWEALSAAVVVVLLGVAAVAPGLLGEELTPPAAVYWVVLDLYLAVALAVAAVVFWRLGRDVRAGRPRTALRAIATGSGLLALDAFFRSVVMVLLGLGARLDLAAIDGPARVAQAASALLMVGGGVTAALPRTRAALHAYRSLLILRPLWRAMRDAFPEIILFTPRRAVVELAGVDDVHLRLYRRVIEIRDGMLALRGYLPDTPPTGEPAAEAERIAEALRRRREGAEPVERTGGWTPIGPEMADEVAWLSRVSTAYKKVGGRPVSSPPAAPLPRPSGSAR